MLTRPGAGPGCRWMRQINEKVTRTGQESETAPRWWKRYWLIYGSFMFLWLLVVAPLLRHSVPPVASRIQNYESETRIAGLPLWARGSTPRGIIAIGGQPIRLVAIGGLPVGIIAVGGAGGGIFFFSGLCVGLVAFGGGAGGVWGVGGGGV